MNSKTAPQPDITRKIEEILDEFAKWTINNVEHGIYIPLPSPEAVHKLVTLVNEARIDEWNYIETIREVSDNAIYQAMQDRIKELNQ